MKQLLGQPNTYKIARFIFQQDKLIRRWGRNIRHINAALLLGNGRTWYKSKYSS